MWGNSRMGHFMVKGSALMLMEQNTLGNSYLENIVGMAHILILMVRSMKVNSRMGSHKVKESSLNLMEQSM